MSFRLLNFRSLKLKMRVIFHEILIYFFPWFYKDICKRFIKGYLPLFCPTKNISRSRHFLVTFHFHFHSFFSLVPSSSLQFQFTGKIMLLFGLQLSLTLFTSFSLFYYYPKYNLKIHVISILYHIF